MWRALSLSGLILQAGLLGLLGGLCGCPTVAPAEESNPRPTTNPQGAILEVNEENDWFAGTDRHYTQGARLVYLGPDNGMPQWLQGAAQRLPAIGFGLDTCRVGLEVGQSAFTPTDLSKKNLITNDWPYAGWLYAGAILQRRGLTDDQHIPVLENIRLQLGVVGPAAHVEQVQNTVHVMGNFTYAQGWDNQLPNEPGLALKYQRAWRWSPSGPEYDWDVDCIPYAGASLGNVDTSARAGATLRVGWHLPDDFGIQPIDSLGVTDGGRPGSDAKRPWSLYFFGGVEGRAIAYNIFLDGDMFRDSPHVERKPCVGELNIGFDLDLGGMDLAFMFVYLTKEFVGQTAPDAYGSVLARWAF